MRTEVKVGLFIGLLIILGGFTAFLVQQNRKGTSGVTDVVDFDAPPNAPPPAAKTGPNSVTPQRKPEPAHPGTTPPRPGANTPTHPPAGSDANRPQTTPPVTPGGPRPATSSPPPAGPPQLSAEELRERIRETLGGGAPSGVTTLPSSTGAPAVVTPPAVERPTTTPPLATQPSVVERPRPAPAVPVPAPTDSTARPPSATTGLPGARNTPPGTRQHTVAEGETLWAIAEEAYGDGALFAKIVAANPGLDPDVLVPGRVLDIPPKEAPAAPPVTAPRTTPGASPAPAKPATTPPGTPPPAAPTTAAKGRTYVVERGDSLISIARNVLKNESRWREIYELNKARIKNPDVLIAGTELKLPEK